MSDAFDLPHAPARERDNRLELKPEVSVLLLFNDHSIVIATFERFI